MKKKQTLANRLGMSRASQTSRVAPVKGSKKTRKRPFTLARHKPPKPITEVDLETWAEIQRRWARDNAIGAALTIEGGDLASCTTTEAECCVGTVTGNTHDGQDCVTDAPCDGEDDTPALGESMLESLVRHAAQGSAMRRPQSRLRTQKHPR